MEHFTHLTVSAIVAARSTTWLGWKVSLFKYAVWTRAWVYWAVTSVLQDFDFLSLPYRKNLFWWYSSVWQVQQFGETRLVALCLVFLLVFLFVLFNFPTPTNVSAHCSCCYFPDIIVPIYQYCVLTLCPLLVFTQISSSLERIYLLDSSHQWSRWEHQNRRDDVTPVQKYTNSTVFIYLLGLPYMWSSHHHGDVFAGPAICKSSQQVLLISTSWYILLNRCSIGAGSSMV